MHRPLPSALPCCAGIGLRAPHHAELLERRPTAGWLEVHSENFFACGGAALRFLETVRAHYPLSLHGVGLSLGSGDDAGRHLAKLKALVERVDPVAVSEHLCWSSVDGRHLNDLLPLPCSEAALDLVCARVDAVQNTLRRTILVENVASYVEFADSTMPEWEFISEVARRSGCGILLDVNNVYVSACNHAFAARRYLDAIPAAAVGEIHLAGYEHCDDFLIDTHGRPVQPPVWQLYEAALARFGPRPTLIEWDTDIPPLAVLLAEAARANACLGACHARVV